MAAVTTAARVTALARVASIRDKRPRTLAHQLSFYIKVSGTVRLSLRLAIQESGYCLNFFMPMRTTRTTDSVIRLALHCKRLNRLKAQPNTLVIDELGLAHARSRVDVAVINGCIHGYEIKSAKDRLDRLQGQIDVYRQALQKVTVVAASRHLEGVLAVVPQWCGIIEVEQGSRGGVQLRGIRPAGTNPDVDSVVLAQLLWKPEVIQLLSQRGYDAKKLRRPRKQLYEMLSETLTTQEITSAIRLFMLQRQTWRGHPAHV